MLCAPNDNIFVSNFFPELWLFSANFGLSSRSRRINDSMDGPTKKCRRCRKEKPLDATEFKRTTTRDEVFNCLSEMFGTNSRRSNKKGERKERESGWQH